ncbi:MAG: O-antigen ligase family protein [Solirubrobacterales bacterium]|nr:O-antigen ligase family protein [Solirubrobacterales bacterium]
MESSIATLPWAQAPAAAPARTRWLILEPALWLSATISATMFSGNWGLLGVPIPLDRVCFGLTFATLALRTPLDASFRLRLRPVHVAMGLALAYVIVSAAVSGTLRSHDGLFALLDRFGLVPFVAFTIAPVVFRTRRERTVLLVVLAISGAYLGLTALFETVGLHALVFPKYILDPNVGIHAGRARGPFAEASANGMALWVCVVACALLAARVRATSTRWFVLLIALLSLGGVFFTLTRAIWFGAAIGGAVTLATYRPLRKYLLAATLVGAAVVTVALVSIPGLASSVQQRTSTDATVWPRYNLNNAAVNMAEAHPLFGVGWDRFTAVADHYYQLGKTYPLVTSTAVHNVYLSNLAELGLIGVTLWLAALVLGLGGALFRRAPPELRRWQYGLTAIVIEWAVCASFGPLAFAFANTSLWVWAGIVYGPTACPLVLKSRAIRAAASVNGGERAARASA